MSVLPVHILKQQLHKLAALFGLRAPELSCAPVCAKSFQLIRVLCIVKRWHCFTKNFVLLKGHQKVYLAICPSKAKKEKKEKAVSCLL